MKIIKNLLANSEKNCENENFTLHRSKKCSQVCLSRSLSGSTQKQKHAHIFKINCGAFKQCEIVALLITLEKIIEMF